MAHEKCMHGASPKFVLLTAESTCVYENKNHSGFNNNRTTCKWLIEEREREREREREMEIDR